MIDFYQSEPQTLGGGFTYAYPNHFSQNSLTKVLQEKLAD